MNEVDTAILVVIILSCIFGLWTGLVKEVLSLLTWIAALLVARVYSEGLSELFVNVIDNSSVRYATAFVIIFIVIMMLGRLLNHQLSKLLVSTGLKLTDRVLGGMFGIARGALIVMLILFISNLFLSETEQWQQSTLIPYGMAMTEWSRIFIADMNAVNLAQ
ncbi:MAG: CvpA family protein [Pseudohongiellaceae bacterium]